ncbi:glycoside hydrolase family 31 protein [Anaerocolumna chitinilytica]|uniref:Glycosyl hydrolase family 31 n=1 Tax=Anaerocolumna chitinilytica TaxID=1727145 RepID=A0A7I8DKQ0_9FIRM|nr:glycoside hydrolase family 31 protein [Anaerocolumna chitinilytica]BCJ98257.1 glycosyl hydrolase family 31 [Anaerocolumna chitinilytica]
MKERILENEYWYGTCVKYGLKMPFDAESECVLDFRSNETPNQAMPFLVSSKGRFLWRKSGFQITFQKGEMEFPDDVILKAGFGNLKSAYLSAMKEYFPFHQITPSKALFNKVIYNTWIEFTFYQNQKDILEYAKSILDSGMPAGVLMIDDGWAEYYGDWKFHSGKFPDAKEMIDSLHEMGFEVMVWMCPYITPDTVAYREAVKRDILIKRPDGEAYIAKWWNGYSAVLDMSNPMAQDWLSEQLHELQEIGVNGFKFDGGDSLYYREDNVTYEKLSPDEHSNLWARYGEQFEFNEFRVSFGAGGYGLLQRLCDKDHSWGDNGIASLIPDILLQGLTGHPFGCPDMIGGGEYVNFQEAAKNNLDQELFIRHCEIACLMPAIQFSAAPFRVLSEENFKRILKSLEYRKQYLDIICHFTDLAAVTGEPVIRYMSYEYPEESVEKVIDQFMIGDRLLVAPIYQKGCAGREVYIPRGKWKNGNETIVSKGEKLYYESLPGCPLVFEKI